MLFSVAQISVNAIPFDNEFVAVSDARFFFSLFFFLLVPLNMEVPLGLNLLHEIFNGVRGGLFTHK